MRYPKQINIKGTVYTIVQVDKFKDKKTEAGIDCVRKIIKIKRRTKHKFADFVHELIHAILYEAGVRQLDETLEEIIVEALTDDIVHYFEWKGKSS